MKVQSPDDEEAEEYGEYSRYTQLQEPNKSAKITASSGVVYVVPKKDCSGENFDDEKYTKLERDDKKVPHVITGEGLTYAIPNKSKTEFEMR